ncbi:hypothetical protein I7I53_03085 [Histoplasma capsulatum var. duboisii H88]|uniref:Uncharacterized protein n=1 Tax=Ajellomyces capsulatus (strain H88) TaxID=544711 RepID=A0A8A1LS36_AJEC8|nr:hypothetical protein I7I53_03085 [Histoplasma capsulatum var. duboisii H88]
MKAGGKHHLLALQYGQRSTSAVHMYGCLYSTFTPFSRAAGRAQGLDLARLSRVASCTCFASSGQFSSPILLFLDPLCRGYIIMTRWRRGRDPRDPRGSLAE